MNHQSKIKTISILGCGWLGLPLGQLLAREGYQVKGSTTTERKLTEIKQGGIIPYLLEVGESVTGSQKDDFFKTDLIILNIPPGRRRPDVEIHHPRQVKRVFEEAIRAKVKYLIFIGSTGVYGNTNRLVTEEDFPLPETSSGRALLAVENFLNNQDQISVTILRMAGLVGGDRKAGRFLAGRKEVANGGAPINLVHRDDCLNVIREVINQGKWGRTYNVCADEHPTRRDFYMAQAKKQGFEPPTFSDDHSLSFKIISNQRVKKELNYTFQHPDPMEF